MLFAKLFLQLRFKFYSDVVLIVYRVLCVPYIVCSYLLHFGVIANIVSAIVTGRYSCISNACCGTSQP